MTDKELKRLSRVELIDIIYELQKQKEAADAQVVQLQDQLNTRELHIAEAGSIAEAAISVNGVFEAAQAAADQYLFSIKAATANMAEKMEAAEKLRQSILQAAEQQAQETLRAAEQQAQKIVADADRQAEEKWVCFERRANELIAAHAELQRSCGEAGSR